MEYAHASSANYDFRRHFDSISRPGVVRYLKHLGYGVDEVEDENDGDLDPTYYTDAKTYAWRLFKALHEAQEFCELGVAMPGYPEITTWSLESAIELANTRLEDMLGATEDGPVDLYRAVHLGTEMARKQGLDVGPEAVAYAADRLKSKLERDAVYNPVTTVHSGFLSYRFLKGMRGGWKVVYTDSYKRRRAVAPEPRPVAAEPGIQHGEVLPVFSAASLAGQPVPLREWAVPDLIPFDTVTMLSGDGGVGKSLLAKQLAVAFSTDTEWLGLKPECGPVLFVSAEDDRDELHRRIASIADSEGIDLADLHDLHVVPLAGLDAVMGATEGRGCVVKETAVWRGLVRIVESVKPRLIVLDTLADIFGGNELARTEARQFIGQLRGLAIKHGLAVLLLSHPSLSGMASGAGTSGSTAWSNSVRSRLYLETVKGDDGIEADPDLRTLTTKKANYGARGGEIKLRWSAGRFVRDGEPARFTFGKAGDPHAAMDEEFMSRLAKYLATGRDLSPSPNAKNYAPEVLADGARQGRGRLPGKVRVASVQAYERAMERAFMADTICVDYQGPRSRQVKTIAIR
jgi:RecA-family ATPase